MKRFRKTTGIISFLLVITILFSGCFQIPRNIIEQENKPQGSTMMWEVTSPSKAGKLYLVGSIHIGDESMYPLNGALTDAFLQSDVLAVEADIVAFQKDMELQMKYASSMLYTDGTTLKDHISRETYDALQEKLKNITLPLGYTPETLGRFNAITVSQVIEQTRYEKSGLNPSHGVDTYFLTQAHENNMPVAEIESVEFQFKMMMDFSDEIQEMILKSSISQSDIVAEMYLQSMIDCWKNGDAKKLEELVIRDEQNMKLLSPEDKALYEEYNKQMITDRNAGMLGKAEEYLGEGKTYFYVVGAAHMLGESGLVHQLQLKGYTVTKK